ncbi:MAG: glycerol-3-phosphate 1-O-acyltransferase PlsY [Candidatus Marinimicrobia bacterium]|nr:glycerol-3-phosphate 1-O-acyltransferase PlsY [Candidatus Neomarinimicrobiota bacterium]
MNVNSLLVLILAYLIGSFPTAWILGKIFAGKKYDIREHGSGNVGTTNAIRNLGWWAGMITLIIDGFKGFAVIFWLSALLADVMAFETARVVLASMVLIGHTFPVFINFRGGKGVATTAGIIFAFRPEIGFICLVVFVTVVLLSRKSAVASITATFFFPISNIIFLTIFDIPISPQMLWFSIAVPFFVLFTHRENISQMIRGKNKKDF